MTRQRPMIGMPVVIRSGADGKVIFSRMVFIVPDEQKEVPEQPGLWGFPMPLVIRRSHYARLIRQWLRDPATPRDARNFPAVDEVIGMFVRRSLLEILEPSGKP